MYYWKTSLYVFIPFRIKVQITKPFRKKILNNLSWYIQKYCLQNIIGYFLVDSTIYYINKYNLCLILNTYQYKLYKLWQIKNNKKLLYVLYLIQNKSENCLSKDSKDDFSRLIKKYNIPTIKEVTFLQQSVEFLLPKYFTMWQCKNFHSYL